MTCHRFMFTQPNHIFFERLSVFNFPMSTTSGDPPSDCESSLTRTVLITGSTDGIGFETAQQIVTTSNDTFVIIHGRSEARAKEAVHRLGSENSAKLGYVVGDFSQLSQVVELAKQVEAKFPSVNIVLCNAGVLEPRRQVSIDGFELTFQVNHLAHFLLIQKLLPLLEKNTPSRVVIVSSLCHDWHSMDWDDLMAVKRYEKYVQYSRSKLANHLFGFELARRLKKGVTCNVMEPGVIETKLLRNGGFSGAPIEYGAVTPVYLVMSNELDHVSESAINFNFTENMNTETARKCIDALSAGGGRYWDCRVLTGDGVFKANAIQLAEFPQIEKLLKLVEIGNKSDNQPGWDVWDLDLTKYSKKAVLEFLRFVYLSETAFSADTVENVNDPPEHGRAMKRKTECYLAEEVWSLARELDIEELKKQCIKAQNLAMVTITVDEGNFQSSAQLAVKMNLRPLLLKCSTFFKAKFVADPASAITELREQAPAFLTAAVLELPYRIPPVAVNVHDNTEQEQGVVIDPHNWEDKLFDEVLASQSGAEAMERNLTDFQIHCTNTPADRPIRCHRNVLSRVPHFERMFLQDNEETQGGSVRMKAEKEVVMEILKYLYSGCNNDLSRTLPQTTEDHETFIAEEVINLAQQYGLYKLKEQAHEALLRRCDISHSNVLELLGIAVLYELYELKFKCLCYVFDNRQTLLTTDRLQKADNTAVQAVAECVFFNVSSNIDNTIFCVCDEDSMWTVDMNGTKSSQIEISEIWHPPIQLDDRTLMVLQRQKQAKLFDLIDHSVTDCSHLLFDHYSGSACLLNGDVYVTGGDDDCTDEKVCERYNRATDTWQRVANMNRRRRYHALVVWKGSLLAIGGWDSGSSIERYDAVADEWEVILASENILDHAVVRAAVINNELLVYANKILISNNNKRLWKTDLDANEWVEIPRPTAAMYDGRDMFEREGKVHLIACTRSDDDEQEQIQVFAFDESTNVWNYVLQIDGSADFFATRIVCGYQ